MTFIHHLSMSGAVDKTECDVTLVGYKINWFQSHNSLNLAQKKATKKRLLRLLFNI